MKTIKKWTALALCLALFCALLPQISITAHAETLSGSIGDNIKWTLDTDTGLLTIDGEGDIRSNWDTDEDLPWHDDELSEYVKSAEIHEGITGTGGAIFAGCEELGSVSLPNSLKNIGQSAFWGCTALTEITIPENVDTICESAFRACDRMTAIRVAPENEYYFSQDGVLLDGKRSELIQYPAGKKDASYQIPDTVMIIGPYAFSECTRLTELVIPDSVTELGNSMCEFNTALQKVAIGSGVTEIPAAAFIYCPALTEVRMPKGLTSIGSFAFAGCQSLTEVTIPSTVNEIYYSAFSGCEALKNVTIPDSVNFIDSCAFFDCAMTEVTIPASVTTIEAYAFGYCFDDEDEYYNFAPIEGFTVYGYTDSAAATYAAENGIRFIAMDRFVDVTGEDYYFNPVMWAIGHEPAITNGVDDTHFGADDACTREQIVTFLWAANGKPAPTSTESSFSDVDSNAWYCKAVMWAVENKIAKGMEDGTFGVGQPCTRAQAMTFLWAANGKPAPTSTESSFSDVTANDWFCNAVLWAAENGITKGIGDGLFGSNSTCTRAQIITFLYKAAMMN